MDGTVDSFGAKTARKSYAAADGTKTTFEVNFPEWQNRTRAQVTRGDFDVNDLVGFHQQQSTYRKQRRYEPYQKFIFFWLKEKYWKQITNVSDLWFTGFTKLKEGM
jgi:hypothetical protein